MKISMTAVVGSVSALLLSGCHRATEQECERILERIVELELRGTGSSEQIARRKTETLAQKRPELMASCVGNYLPKSALVCIEQAQTSKEVTEKCLR